MCIPTYKTVDTCAAEFAAETPYHYSTYEDDNEVRPSDRPRVVILGSGPEPHRAGDRVRLLLRARLFALRDAGYETVMINCNPETVSTDYDTSDRLYFEPLTREDVLNVIAAETVGHGGVAPKVIVSLGGQTPLKLAGLLPARARSPARRRIDRPRRGSREVERRCATTCASRSRRAAPPPISSRRWRSSSGSASRCSCARATCSADGRCRSCTTATTSPGRWPSWPGSASLGREGGLSAERPVLIDRFLEDATEVDVDAIRDHTGEVVIGGVMEHVEEAGVHSGDSACAIPPQTLPGGWSR